MYQMITLNEHNNYLKLLNILETRTKYIEYVVLDEEDTSLIESLQDDIINQKTVNKWWGTKTSQHCNLYRIKASSKLFSLLKSYSTFCHLKTGDWGDYTEPTDFGINDMAFFDDQREPLLFTTTHEGYINIRKDLLHLLK